MRLLEDLQKPVAGDLARRPAADLPLGRSLEDRRAGYLPHAILLAISNHVFGLRRVFQGWMDEGAPNGIMPPAAPATERRSYSGDDTAQHIMKTDTTNRQQMEYVSDDRLFSPKKTDANAIGYLGRDGGPTRSPAAPAGDDHAKR